MPVRSVKDQYRGINAHLHSYWQAKGGWDSFHVNHIADLTRSLKAQLFPMGYTAEIQESLQIRRAGKPAGKPESDVMIYDRDASRPSLPLIKNSSDTHQLAFPILEILENEIELEEYHAVAIYDLIPDTTDKGEPVAWIELLSPSNKPGGADAAYYRDKRLKLLRGGMVFVEIDYLHESSPTFQKLASYQRRKNIRQEDGSHPYRIVVIDPRPVFDEGEFRAWQFDVDEAIPIVDIPLNADDVLHFDFGTPYAKTFEEMLYGQELVDYTQFPLNFDRYSDADQTRIARRMLAVLEAARDGIPLASGILPTQETTLEDAISQIKALAGAFI